MGLPNGSGQVSHPRDFGTSPHATLFRWRAKTQFDANPSNGAVVEMYWATFDEASAGVPVSPDGNVPSGDKTYNVSAEQRRNLQFIGSVSVDLASSGVPFVTSGLTQLYSRYGALVWVNNGGAALSAQSGVHEFVLVPVPDEIQ